jgi:hypothetical protein
VVSEMFNFWSPVRPSGWGPGIRKAQSTGRGPSEAAMARMTASVSFIDPAVIDRPLMLAGAGIFVREDEVIRRGLRVPSGVFKPRLVRFTGVAQ